MRTIFHFQAPELVNLPWTRLNRRRKCFFLRPILFSQAQYVRSLNIVEKKKTEVIGGRGRGNSCCRPGGIVMEHSSNL